MNRKVFLALFFLVVSSLSVFANSYFVEPDRIYSDIDESIALQNEKLELSHQKLDGYLSMLDETSSKISQNIYTPIKIDSEQ